MPRVGAHIARVARGVMPVRPPTLEPHVIDAERRLVEALGLRSRTLQPRFAQSAGLWKDAPVAITTRTYEGDAVGYMRLALIGGAQLSIGSLLVCARPNRALPILVGELISRVGRESTIAVDLIPVTEGLRRDADCRAFALQLPNVAHLPRVDADGTQSGEWSSPCGLHARVTAEQLNAALGAFDLYVDSWITLSAAAVPVPESADAVRRRQQEFMHAQRGDVQTRSLLVAMFGRAWADDYVEQVLFPSS